ncbi:MAG: response regulator [Gammaproteobacteria bacterium]|nr:response regulator [Gammaproteobacteria bacterium]
MGNELRKVIIVDDDPTVSELLSTILVGKFEPVTVGENAEQINNVIRQTNPCCVLLDVKLATTDGRKLCHDIKEEFGEQSPPIILVSGDSSEDTIISCFENGADDFIPKPFSFTSVVRKIESLLRYENMLTSLQSQSDELTELVNTTMSQASSYGAVLSMVKKINLNHSEETISQCVFDYLASEGLSSAIYFTNQNESRCFDQKARICSPLIKELFELAHNRKRLYKLGTRLLISDKHVSILIKNPPVENTEQYGIFIDVIAVIIEALEARYLGLLREQRLGMLDSELSQVILELHHSVEEVRAKKQKLIDDIVLRIGLSFHELELTELQEEFFSKLLEDTVMGHDDNNNVISQLQDKLASLVEQIHELVVHEEDKEEQGAQVVGEEDFELF